MKYADDTVIYYANNDVDVIENVLNSEMKIIGSYCSENELLLNLKKGKTESMLFGTAKRLRQNTTAPPYLLLKNMCILEMCWTIHSL